MSFMKPIVIGLFCLALFACTAPSPEQKARFDLQDHHGNRLTANPFGDKLNLIFFGYSSCPDICPTDMQLFSETMDLLGEEAKRIQPIFVTIDPERDNISMLEEFMSNFHPDIIGVTGDPANIEALATVYEAEYSKSFYKDEDEPNGLGYLMNHSAWIYLVKPGRFMTPDADLLELWGHGITPEQLTRSVKPFLKRGFD